MGGVVSSPEWKIVLLGKTGVGKSSSGNTILQRKNVFIPDSSPNSTTCKSVRGHGTVDGRNLTVIDTPGLFDTNTDNDETIKPEIIRAITECAPGIDAFVIVLRVDRFTDQEIEIVQKISKYCGEDTYKHAVVLFTHGEDLKGQTIEEFVQKSTTLKELVDKCGGRCHVIDNYSWKQRLHCPCSCGYKSNNFQVKNMLDTINEMVKRNGRYTNELMLIAEQEIKKEMKNNEDNISSEERRERAKKNVFDKFLIRLAGVTTGMLVGAFLGVGVAVASVVALLKGTNCNKALMLGIAAAKVTAAVSGAAAGGIVTAAGAAAVEAGVAAGIGAAAGAGIAAGAAAGAAALAGAIGGGITGYKATEEADCVHDAIKFAAKANYENAKGVVEKAHQLPLNVRKKFQ